MNYPYHSSLDWFNLNDYFINFDAIITFVMDYLISEWLDCFNWLQEVCIMDDYQMHLHWMKFKDHSNYFYKFP